MSTVGGLFVVFEGGDGVGKTTQVELLCEWLADAGHARIDLRQIGSRDAASLVGGLGNCGRDLCCATFLTDFEPVTIRMPKNIALMSIRYVPSSSGRRTA